MTFLVFLNELSCPVDAYDEAVAQGAVAGLVATLKALRKVQGTAALHSSVPLGQISLGKDAWLGALAEGPLRDEWRYLRGFDNRAPFRVDLGQAFGLESEYRYEDECAEGLGLSHALGTLSVSLAFARWNHSTLELQRIYMADDGEFSSEQVEICHACSAQHISALDEWLRRAPLAHVNDGDDLWHRRGELFPHLQFLAQVEGQVRGLRAGEVRLHSAAAGLMDLEVAVARWDYKDTPLPTFLTKVTPEHEQRRKKFQFKNLAGVVQSFDQHSRFTPGAGRIHLWCDRSNGTATIAHVGEKVPD
jgi:hypothetical protein